MRAWRALKLPRVQCLHLANAGDRAFDVASIVRFRSLWRPVKVMANFVAEYRIIGILPTFVRI